MVPNSGSGTCGQNLVLVGQSPDVIGVSGVVLQNGSTCTLSVDVESSTAGSYSSTTGPITSYDSSLEGQPAPPATLVVTDFPILSEAFVPSTVPVNVPSSLQFTLNNPNTFSLSGVNFADDLPSGLQLTPSVQSAQVCGGNLAASGSSLSLTGGTLGSGAQCTFSVSVSSGTAGTYTNDTGPIGANETGSGSNGASATLTVNPQSTRTLTAITIAPASATIVVDHAFAFTAFGSYSDGSTSPLPSLTWTSSDSNSVSVTSVGVALGLAASSGVTITARDPTTGVSGHASLNVASAGLYAIVVTPDPYQLLVGGAIQLTATGYGTGGTQPMSGLNWSSSSPSIVSVNNQGVATAVGAADSGPVQVIGTDPVTGISGAATLSIVQHSVNVSAQPETTDGLTNLVCAVGGAGPFNWAWRAYRDDGTTAGVVFGTTSGPTSTLTLSTASGEGANFYVFCDGSFTNGGQAAGTGYTQVTLTTGETIPKVIVTPSSIHAGLTDVTFDGTASLNALGAGYWAVQYGGNVVPSGLDGYLQIPAANWTTVPYNFGPGVLSVVTIPATYFSVPGAYRVQLRVQSNIDFTFNEGTYYFQVAP
jgi:hypothetical protein